MHQARTRRVLDSQHAAHFARGLCMALGTTGNPVAILLVLLSPGLLVAFACFFVPAELRRKTALLSAALFSAAILFIAAVNVGWISP